MHWGKKRQKKAPHISLFQDTDSSIFWCCEKDLVENVRPELRDCFIRAAPHLFEEISSYIPQNGKWKSEGEFIEAFFRCAKVRNMFPLYVLLLYMFFPPPQFYFLRRLNENEPPLKRTKGVPQAIGRLLNEQYFSQAKDRFLGGEFIGDEDSEDEADGCIASYFSYEKMKPTAGLEVVIAPRTSRFTSILNKKRHVLKGGNHSRPLF